MADISIHAPSVQAAPKPYTITGTQDLVIRGITASFDGTSAGGLWVPAVQIIDPSGTVAGTYPYASALTAGASADVSWFPGVTPPVVSGVAGTGMGATVRLTGNYAVTTGDPGTIINWTSAVADTGSPTPFWNASHPARLTAPVTGWYLSTIRPIWDYMATTGGQFATYLYKNTETVTIPTSFAKTNTEPLGDATNSEFTYDGATHGAFYMNAGDYFIVNAYVNTGSGAGIPATLNLLDNNTSVPAIPAQFTFWSLTFLGGMIGPAGPTGGGLAIVEDGTTTVTSANTLKFTSGATVTDGGGGLAEVAVNGGGGGSLLAVVYNTTGGNKTTTSATLVDVDAANAVITFTAPASGNVLVRVTCEGSTNANQNAFLGLRESTTNIAGPVFAWNTNANTTGYDASASLAFYLSGISAGSHTYKVAFAVNGGATMTVREASASPVVIEVWAAP